MSRPANHTTACPLAVSRRYEGAFNEETFDMMQTLFASHRQFTGAAVLIWAAVSNVDRNLNVDFGESCGKWRGQDLNYRKIRREIQQSRSKAAQIPVHSTRKTVH
jgi:hypothetical protein